MTNTKKEQRGKRHFYVTTPIYYVNDVPHIGHAYTTIAADILARWHRLLGDDVFFITGTDEHGQKVEKTAREKGLEPKEFCDKLVPAFKEAWKHLNITYDHFLRTTDKSHEDFVKEFILRAHKAGDIYLGSYEGLYCTGCEAFYLEKDLNDGCCPVHKTKAERIKEESYFFRLGKYKEKLIEHIKNSPSFILPEGRRNEILGRLKEELKDLSITRTSFTWGISFPLNEKHVTYVWFDALANYLSGVDREMYWPADVHIVGKDILWFHTVMWGAMLMSAGYELPHTVFAHGWWTVNGEKMSKSLGNVVDPLVVAKKYGADALRFALFRDAVFGEDGDFSEEKLVEHYNSELADSVGNLLQRVVVLLHKNFSGAIPTPGELTTEDNEFITQTAVFDKIQKELGEYRINVALEAILECAKNCNRYATTQEPWKIADKKRQGTVLYVLTESLRLLSYYLYPFIPTSAVKIADQLGQKMPDSPAFSLETSGTARQPVVLFPKFEIATSKDPFDKLDLRVAEIVEANNHPEAEKLLVLQISLGEEKRQLVAGIKSFYSPKDLVGKHIIIVANLKPAKLRGVESQGMLLAASHGEKLAVLESPVGTPGDRVLLENKQASIAPKQISIEDVGRAPLTTLNSRAVYKGTPLQTTRGAAVAAPIEDGAAVR